MGTSTIPVDLFNPGQVFACLGFLEAADILLGGAKGGFGWSGEEDTFALQADGKDNPVEAVLEFLAGAEVKTVAPQGFESGDANKTADPLIYPASTPNKMALPILLQRSESDVTVPLNHWADGSSRNDFKLYAGNRSAAKIAADMIDLVKPLWKNCRDDLTADPFGMTCAIKGSFNFDPRGAWTAIDAGYSPNEHKHTVEASPIVEFLSAWGMENARPDEFETRKVRYSVWGVPLSPILARGALGGQLCTIIPHRKFAFALLMSGKNKVVQFAEEESSP